MSIASAFSAALTGLTASARRAETVSANIANAGTEGYVRRELSLQARVIMAGVEVVGTQRNVDLVLLADRRSAGAEAGANDLLSKQLRRIEEAVGTPESPASVTGSIAALERSLLSAAADPASESRLSAVVDATHSLTRHFARASDTIQNVRADADQRIDADVKTLNTSLAAIADLNIRIRADVMSGRDVSSLLDQRQSLVDRVATIVPLREVQRKDQQISLFATNGAQLLDGRAAQFSFTPTRTITPAMTAPPGVLSGLTVNGHALNTGPDGPLSGGTLGAAFQLRDGFAVDAQRQLDSVARNLVDRLADPAIDPTRPATAPGLLTDTGGAFDPANEIGLSARLALNQAVDPARGGAVWRLRDGLGALLPGPNGNAEHLMAMQQALADRRIPASGAFTNGSKSLASLAALSADRLAQSRLFAEADATRATARAATLQDRQAADGVDTDAELQDLMQIEKAYAANARVLQTVDDMLATLLGL